MKPKPKEERMAAAIAIAEKETPRLGCGVSSSGFIPKP